MTEIAANLFNNGVLGIVVVIMMSAIVYLQTRINKKDDQLLELTNKSLEAFNSMSNLINSISATTVEIPDKVREKLRDDLLNLEKAITDLKR